MAKGVSIGVAADTREFTTGIKKGVIEPLDDVAEALDDVAKDGDKAGRKLEKAFEDASKETSDFKKEQSELGKAMQRTADQGNDFGRKYKDGADEAGEGLKDFKQEANQTAKESAASFDGSAESIVDVFQEVAANAFAGFGPAGAAAGIAAAVGIGVVLSELTKAGERAEAVREQVKNLTDQLFENEGNTKLLDYVTQLREFLDKPAASDDIISQFNDFFEQSGTNFDQAQRDAKEYKVALTDLLKAYSGGDADAAQKVLEQLTEAQEKANDAAHDAGNRSDMKVYRDQADSIQIVIDKIKDQNSLTDEAVEQYEAISQATDEMAASQEAAAAAIEAVADAAESLQGEIDEAVTSFADFIDAEGNLDPAGYIASIDARIEATSNFNTNVQGLAQQFGLTDEEIQTILDQGLDFAPMLQSIIDSGLTAEYITQIQDAVGGGQDILAGTPLTTEVGVDANTDEAAADIDAVTTKPRTADVDTKTDTKPVEDALTAVTTKKRTATITASLDTSAAESALNAFTSRYRSSTVVVKMVDRNGKEVI